MAQAFVPLVASMLLSARSRSRSRASSAALLAALLAVALAARGASGAQLCAPGESTFDGDWRGPLRNSTADDVQAYCPATLARIRGEYQRHYLCEGKRTYEVARWAGACDAMPANASAARVASCLPGGVVAFVGDSLTQQQYFAFVCALERAGAGAANLTATYTDTHHLRSDLPCVPQCASNASYYAANRGTGVPAEPRCSACDATGAPRQRLPTAQEPWYVKLPAATRVVVVGSGSWYSATMLGEEANTSALYAETLSTVAPALQALVIDRGVRVLWLDIPPPAASGGKASHGWSSFSEHNELAARTLAHLAPNVTFLNTSAATAERRVFGASVTTIGIHWCSPGRGTVPAFITRGILHALAQSCPPP
jgi:hypothetical protein